MNTRPGLLSACALGLSLNVSVAFAQECPAPRVAINGDSAQCCWPGQHWSSSRHECSGHPECPSGYQRHHSTCTGGERTESDVPVPAVVPVAVAAEASATAQAIVPVTPPSSDSSRSQAGLTTGGSGTGTGGATDTAAVAASPDARRCGVILGEDTPAGPPAAAATQAAAAATPAPQEPPSSATMATPSVQPLFMRAHEEFNLPAVAAARFRSDLHFEDRYQILNGSLAEGASASDSCPRTDTLNAVRQWCRQATIDLQEQRGDVDAQRGTANLTVAAINERCGMLFEYTLQVSEPRACLPSSSCRTQAVITLSKYRVSGLNESGQPNFELDRAFGTNGQRRFDMDVTLPGTPRISTPFGTVDAMPSMVVSAAGAALGIARKLQEVSELQVHAPVRSVADGSASFCASRREVPLDAPFFVRVRRNGQVEDVGLVRAREVLDGCTLTSSLRRDRTAGRRVRLGPSRAQIIIGGDDVRQGMTLWQMPSIGLGITAGLGIASGQLDTERLAMKDFVVPSGFVGAEYNFGRWAGISEFYAVANVGFGVNFVDGQHSMWQGSSRYATQIRTTLDGLGFAPNLRVELGVLKRVYFGRSFFEATALGYFGTTMLGTEAYQDYTIDYSLSSFGGVGMLGIGWALSPRLLFRLDAGVQVGVASPTVTVTTPLAQINVALPGGSIELGPTLRMMFSYEL